MNKYIISKWWMKIKKYPSQEIEAELIRTTDKAICIHIKDQLEDTWIPKSQIRGE